MTQARLSSSRLPRKILLDVDGDTILSLHFKRISSSKLIDKIIIATTFEKGIDKVINLAKEFDFEYYQGSENNVLKRFYEASKLFSPDLIVRVTSDCPLIDSELIDELIEFTYRENLDYASNTLIENFPDGQDIEVFKFKALEFAYKNAKLNSEKEHVTPYIIKNSTYKGGKVFKSMCFKKNIDYGIVRMTLDTIEDYDSILKLIRKCGKKAGWKDYANYYLENFKNFTNNKITRNQGYINSLKNEKI